MKTFKEHFLNENIPGGVGSDYAINFASSVIKQVLDGIAKKTITIGSNTLLFRHLKTAYNYLEDVKVTGAMQQQGIGESRTNKDKPKFTETTIRKTWVGKRPSVHGDRKYNRNKFKQIPND